MKKIVRLSEKIRSFYNARAAVLCVAVVVLASIVVYTSLGSAGAGALLIPDMFVPALNTSSIGEVGASVAPKSNARNCAIIYLANQPRFPDIVNSLNALFEFSNSKYKYPVIMFYDDKNGTEHFDTAGILSQLKISEEDKKLIRFEYVQFVFPEGFSEANKSQVTVWPHAFPPYNHMIAFWGYYIFSHPLVRDLEYFWRLDTDAFILEPVKVDLFDVMRSKRYRYGYQEVLLDPDFVTMGLAMFIQDYIRKNNVTVAQPDQLSLALGATGERQALPDYYNNFEIVHVPTFLRRDMREFSRAFLMTYRIYTHRWGDHVQRYAMVNMFLNQNEVHQVCECSYKHQGVQKKASC